MSAVIDRHPEVESYRRSLARGITMGNLLNLAEAGGVAIVEERGSRPATALVELGRLRHMLARLIEPHMAVASSEDGRWCIRLPGLPVLGEGASFDEASADLIEAMREYADDWADHLHAAPNHEANEYFAHFVKLSNDEQLREWIYSAER
ncbi:prevent-host-death protein [Mycolicibacterium wolinskyi]|uniref:prevent-host-death protein n=1 Tax=Mycolicibacterium wolinskyi TaxID=59750 RepID=UPI0039178D33